MLLITFMPFVASAQNAVGPNLIESDLPFTPEGKIESVENKYRPQREFNKIESGILNGVAYRVYYSDGSGFFAGTAGNTGHQSEPLDSNWSVACKKDSMNDTKQCYMKMKDLWIFVYPKSKVSISVGHDRYPRSSVAIRIDQGKPFETLPKDEGQFSSIVSVKLIPLLGKSQTITTRFVKWPQQNWIDKSWEMYGFNETYKYISWAVEHIK